MLVDCLGTLELPSPSAPIGRPSSEPTGWRCNCQWGGSFQLESPKGDIRSLRAGGAAGLWEVLGDASVLWS